MEEGLKLERTDLLDTSPSTTRWLRPGPALPLARYALVFRMQDGLRLPEFAGSLLRGQFGASLRRIACMTGLPECPGCPLYRTCPYPAIFETPPPPSHALQRFSQVPNPYVIEPPRLGRAACPRARHCRFTLSLSGAHSPSCR